MPDSADATFSPTTGTVVLRFDETVLSNLGWAMAARGSADGDGPGLQFSFPVAKNDLPVRLATDTAASSPTLVGGIRTQGGLLITHPLGRFVVGYLEFQSDVEHRFSVVSHIGAPFFEDLSFGPSDASVQSKSDDGVTTVRVAGPLPISKSLARALGKPRLEGIIVGTFDLTVELAVSHERAGQPPGKNDDMALQTTGEQRSTIGPDVIVGNLHDLASYGTDTLTGIAAFAIGTVACNAGDVPLSWFASTEDHPVIQQNMYRMKDGRFEQIGMSWVKHGFATVNGNSCQFGCAPPPQPGAQLGVGCSDPYSASLNGQQNNMGPGSSVNPHTGVFPYPWSAPPAAPLIGRRLQVHRDDLDPALNAGALYFVQGHYIHPEDAAAGNQNNNASYRRIIVTQFGLDYVISTAGGTSRENCAIRAWHGHDNSVFETDAQIPDDGLLILSVKTTDLGDGTWHYEYALQNLNADRAVRAFSIPVEPATALSNFGFHDVAWHSGEPYDDTDWSISIGNGLLTWSTDAYSVNRNANALRWGTLYNFRFDANVPPDDSMAALALFKPGTPPTIQVATKGPSGSPSVCGNGVIQAGEDCDPPNGITCDETCSRIPTCGDGILDEGEACDPPDGIFCDGFCQFLANNICQDAVPVCPGQYEGSTATASNDGGSTCGSSGSSRDVWYRYTPSIDGSATFDTCGSGFDTVLSVHTGCPGITSNQLACDDDGCYRQSRITLDVTAGETYVIRVTGYLGDAGSFTLSVSGPDCVPEPPANDECASALPIGEGTINFDTEGAGTSAPLEIGECNVNRDIWYCYQATCTGTAIASLCDSFFDTALAVYDGCVCPTDPSAIACNDDSCSSQSEISFAATAGSTYLVRVGGRQSARGPGSLTITCEGAGDPIRGGRLWDEWWIENGAAEPAGEHPLYPVDGQQTGSTTYRCKECHGWDYRGDAGAYASGSHYTGIPGVLGTQLSRREIFDLLKSDAVANGHGYANYGMSNQDIWDLVDFVLNLAIDTDPYVDATGSFVGDEAQGDVHYTSGGTTACAVCHGADGTAINFGTPNDPVWVGTIAQNSPWELFHKIRFGQPGANMPSWLSGGGTDQTAADIGRYAQLSFPTRCTEDAHCDDGLFCTGQERCIADACSDGPAPCTAQACDEQSDVCVTPDPLRGGRLWDNWWVVRGLPAPSGDHPLYPPSGQQTGSTTFRCKECHGWDYKGVDGAYGSGTHFTGIPGVLGSALSPEEMFEIITTDLGPSGHAFLLYGLTEIDAWDLVNFMQNLLIDDDVYIDSNAAFIGDAMSGESAYTSVGVPACIVCHGADGTQMNFGTPAQPEWVGTVSTYNPWEFLHKVRVGVPDQTMPTWLGNGGTDQGAADIGKYAQLNFPVDCKTDAHCDDALYCNGTETCVNTFCTAGVEPCLGLLCDDEIDVCMTGNCPAPTVRALAGRYIEITPPAGTDPVAISVAGDPDDAQISCLLDYVQMDGTLGTIPVFQTPAQWGILTLTGQAIQPEKLYKVRTVCGSSDLPDPSYPDSAVTDIWADVDHNLTVNFNDVYRIIKAFQEDYTLVTLQEADLEPCEPNRVANFADVLIAILAWQGKTFADLGCATLCP